MKLTRTNNNEYKAETEKTTYFITHTNYRTWRVEVVDDMCEIHLIDICPSKQAALDVIKWEEAK